MDVVLLAVHLQLVDQACFQPSGTPQRLWKGPSFWSESGALRPQARDHVKAF